MENKDWAYQIIANDAIKMNNGDNMVDVSTAYLAVDRARADERHRLLADWEPTTKPVPTIGLVDVLFQTGRSGRSWVTMYTTGFILYRDWICCCLAAAESRDRTGGGITDNFFPSRINNRMIICRRLKIN